MRKEEEKVARERWLALPAVLTWSQGACESQEAPGFPILCFRTMFQIIEKAAGEREKEEGMKGLV